MKPLEASLFKPLQEDLKDQLILSRVVPINDDFLPLWGNTNKINLLYGSYGSGKSVFIVDELIDSCLNDEYFRCYFGRKILQTVRGTVFKTIIDRIVELKKDHLFHYSTQTNGSMIIVCKKNKNEFIPFGCNNPQSLKSIKDPSHFFCEEFDQFSFTDFGYIYSRLRTEKANTQLYGAFNTEKIYQSHWIRKLFFDGEFKDQSIKHKSTFRMNYFIDQDEYYKKLQLIANGNVAVLNAIANAEWGVVRTGGEFWKQFNETKHVGKVEYVPGVIYLSLDENVNPYVTCTCWQVRGTGLFQIKEILCESPDNNAPKAAQRAADWLYSLNHKDMVFVCGDPSGRSKSTVDENSKSFFDKFIEGVRNRGFKVTDKVMKSAPEVALSGAFVNAIYENNLYGWSIMISDQCFSSIEDYIMVKEDSEGKMQKLKEKDPETKVTYEPRGHISDSKRYFILTVLAKQFEEYKGRVMNLKKAVEMGHFR